MELEEYVQYRETKLHEQPGFRYNTYLCTIPLDFSRVELHWHEQMEIIYIKKGTGSVTVGAHTWPVEAGMIVPILPGELHAIEEIPGSQMEYENIIFALSILDSTEETDWIRASVLEPLRSGELRFPRPIVPGTALHKEVSAALDEADRACDQGGPGYSMLVKSSLYRFLHALYAHRTETPPEHHRSHQAELKKVLQYVKEHFAEELPVEKAAELAGYSASHFMRLFREETGRTFSDYVLQYRLQYAGYLLKESSGPVGEVAMTCGFNNLSYFIRAFKKRYGVSPREYRKK